MVSISQYQTIPVAVLLNHHCIALIQMKRSAGPLPALQGKLQAARENARLRDTVMSESLRTELHRTVGCLGKAKFEAEKRKHLT